MEEDSCWDHCDDPDCLICLQQNSLVACYEDLPEWMFVLTQLDGGDCEVVVYDRDHHRLLSARGVEMELIMSDLRTRSSKGTFTF
jgi:hypothetical protein